MKVEEEEEEEEEEEVKVVVVEEEEEERYLCNKLQYTRTQINSRTLSYNG